MRSYYVVVACHAASHGTALVDAWLELTKLRDAKVVYVDRDARVAPDVVGDVTCDSAWQEARAVAQRHYGRDDVHLALVLFISAPFSAVQDGAVALAGSQLS